MDFIHSDIFLWGILCISAILLILYIANSIKLSKLRKNYKEFMLKLGKGNDIEESLKTYIDRVEKVERKNDEIIHYCENLDNQVKQCMQKIGLVRYNAFKDTGSDLSFTLAILDEKNNGVVLNGIYSRETSNIYAKPIKNGTSSYTLSKEEKEALEKAMKE